MFDRLKKLSLIFRREVRVYRLVIVDPQTPLLAKVLVAIAVFYVCLPFDLIPDWLPVIGILDDLLLVPVLLVLARQIIPKEVIASCRAKANVVG